MSATVQKVYGRWWEPPAVDWPSDPDFKAWTYIWAPQLRYSNGNFAANQFSDTNTHTTTELSFSVLTQTVVLLPAFSDLTPKGRVRISAGGEDSPTVEADTASVPPRGPWGSGIFTNPTDLQVLTGAAFNHPLRGYAGNGSYALLPMFSWMELNAATGRLTGTAPDYPLEVTLYWHVLRDGLGSAPFYPFTLTVYDAPSRPVKPTPGTPTAATIPLTWLAPAFDGHSDITGYVVRYRVVNTTHWTEITRNTVALNHTIPGLEADTEYEIEVAAVNAAGTGAWSYSAFATTA